MKRYLLLLLSIAMVASASATVYQSVSPEEGVVMNKPSIRQINLTFPNTQSCLPSNEAYAKVVNAMGDSITKVTPTLSSYGDPQLKVATAINVSGDYYMVVPAGAWLLDPGTANQRPSEEFPLHYCLLVERNPVGYTSTSIPAGYCEDFSEVVITFNHTDQLTVEDAASIGLYEHGALAAAASEVTAQGNQLKIHFVNAPNGNYVLTVPSGSVSCHGVPCLEVNYSYEISNAPYGLVPADGATIGMLSQIDIEFKQYTHVTRNLGNGVYPATVTDEAGREVAHSVIEVGRGNVASLYLSRVINTPGTYKVHVPAGLIALNYDWDSFSSEGVSPDFDLTYTVTGATPTPVQISPAEGTIVGSLFGADFVIDTDKEVTLNENCERAYVTGANLEGDYIYTVSLDEEQTNHGHFSFYHTLITAGQYSVVFPAGYFKIGKELSTALEFDYTLMDGDPILPTQVTPASGDTLSFIQDVTLTFGQASELTYVQEYGNTIYVADAEGHRVRGAYVDFYTFGLATFVGNQVKLHFKEAVSTPGDYQIHFGKGVFKVDNDVNTDFTLHFTVADLGEDLVSFGPAIAVENLLTINVTFPEVEKIKLNTAVTDEVEAVLYKAGTNEAVTVVKKAVINGNKAILTLKKTVADPGTYELVIPAHFFFVGEDQHLSQELHATFAVETPDEPRPGSYDVFTGEVSVSLPYASGRYTTSEQITSYGNYSVSFFNVPLDPEGFIDGTGEMIEVEFLSPYSEHKNLDNLVGTYTPAKYKNGIYEAGNFVPGMWSSSLGFYMPAGTVLSHFDDEGYTDVFGLISTGTITVSKLEDGNYQVDFDLTTRENAHVTATYVGDLQRAIVDFTQPEAIETITDDQTQGIVIGQGKASTSCGEKLYLYDLQGRLLTSGRGEIALPQQGTYVLKCNKQQRIIKL